jgi:rfaE bifunctional protein nucleotidyltransferase chain/domain
VSDPDSKILPIDDLVVIREHLRREGKRVVQCHGCFDVVHPGHIRYLRFARTLGDVLIVSVSADDGVGKGFDRPYIPEELRLENLASLEFVDYVCLADATWGGPALGALRPDVYVKGREYETNEDPRFAEERNIVHDYGGEIVFGSGDLVFSSTEIIENRPEAFGLRDERVEAYCRRHGIQRARVDELLSALAGLRILVIGDPILDHYVFCEGTSVAPESPILSVSPVDEEFYVGGGALIASQLAALGAQATLLTSAGQGPMFERFERALERAGVELVSVPSGARPLFVKRRYVAGQQKLLKVNEGFHTPLTDVAVDGLIRYLETLPGDFNAVVATDFGYGFFGDRLCRALSPSSGGTTRSLFADVSTSGQANLLKFGGPKLATPTERELRFALGDMESGLSTVAHSYLRRSGAGSVIVTLAQRGCVSFSPFDEEARRLRASYLPALVDIAVDSVGAGDLFLSGVVLADQAGAPPPVSAYIGACIASVGVSRMGNRLVDLPRLLEFMRRRPELRG